MDFSGMEFKAGCHIAQPVAPPSWDEQCAVTRATAGVRDRALILRALGLLP